MFMPHCPSLEDGKSWVKRRCLDSDKENLAVSPLAESQLTKMGSWTVQSEYLWTGVWVHLQSITFLALTAYFRNWL